MKKKIYTKPELIVHGDVERITLQGVSKNSDSPKGTANTAYPPLPVTS